MIYLVASQLDAARGSVTSVAGNSRELRALTKEFRDRAGIVVLTEPASGDEPDRVPDAVVSISARRAERIREQQQGRQQSG